MLYKKEYKIIEVRKMRHLEMGLMGIKEIYEDPFAIDFNLSCFLSEGRWKVISCSFDDRKITLLLQRRKWFWER